MSIKQIVLALVLHSIPLLLQAQYTLNENRIWAFGAYAGLDFSNGQPLPVKTNLWALEGCASVCDAAGQLLFYTNGRQVWDRQGALMPNGEGGFPATNSTTQAAVIVPMPDSGNKYYVFSLGQQPDDGKLCYSVVNMELNGGLGDVEPGRKGIMISMGFTEKMIAIPGDDCNIWLLLRDHSSHFYKAYEITGAGINTTPVISVTGLLSPAQAYERGVMKVSHDRRKIAAACGASAAPGAERGIELYDFDPATGVISNELVLDRNSPDHHYGVCFSPDNTRLYAYATTNNYSRVRLFQFDLTLPTAVTITASKTELFTFESDNGAESTDLKLGPDNRIYFGLHFGDHLHRINFPDLPGMASQPVVNAVSLLSGTFMQFGFPNEVVLPLISDTVYARKDTVVCFSDSVVLQANAAGWSHVWDGGRYGVSLVARGSGTYIVGYRTNCLYHIDTTVVAFSGRVPAAGFTRGCHTEDGDYAWVTPATSDTAAYTYQWIDSAGTVLQTRHHSYTGDTLRQLSPGLYQVRVEGSYGCDTLLTVRIPVLYDARFAADTNICVGVPARFEDQSAGDPATLYWDMGDGATATGTVPIHTYRSPGHYRVTLTAGDAGGKCSDTFSRMVHVRDFSIGLTASPATADWGSPQTLQSHAAEPYRVLVWHPQTQFPDQAAYEQTLRADTVRPYLVVGESLYGCRDSAVLTPGVNPLIFIPSAFTPDHNGRNDHLRPLFAGEIVRVVSFRIYDRWGKMVWATSGSDAHTGWDGTYNGVPAQAGTYFYMLEVETTANRKVSEKGDITLIR